MQHWRQLLKTPGKSLKGANIAALIASTWSHGSGHCPHAVYCGCSYTLQTRMLFPNSLAQCNKEKLQDKFSLDI